MRTLFTGSNGALGKKYLELFPDTVPISIRYADTESFGKLTNEIKTADVLIHAGANTNPSNIDDALKDNAILPFDILDMAGKINPNTHIILISSSTILDEKAEAKKIREMSFYAASKFIMEEIAAKVAQNPITIVRFSTIFYSDYNRDGLSRLVHTAWKNKSIVATDCKRDFIPLNVACRWLNDLCGNKTWYNKTINLASGRSINMIDVANHLSEKCGADIHRTALPEYADICYKFLDKDPQSLEQINFDIYQLIDEYYQKLEKGK